MGFGNFSISNKIIVVTGGGSGINLAFVRLCAHGGARVLIADLKLSPEAEDLIQNTTGVIFEKCDVSNWADLRKLVEVTEKKFGDVPDIFVAGAGVFEPSWSNFWDDTEEERYAEVDINVNHPIKLTRIAIRALGEKKKKGVVLITASVAGLKGVYAAALYCATKHAVIGFVRSMKDADPLNGVKVVAVAPGKVRTPLWTDHPDKMKLFGYTEEGVISPEEVAASMVSLIEEERYGGGAILEITPSGTRIVE